MQCSLYYDWKHNFNPFWLDGAVKPRDEEGDGHSKLMNYDYVLKQPLAMSGSANE